MDTGATVEGAADAEAQKAVSRTARSGAVGAGFGNAAESCKPGGTKPIHLRTTALTNDHAPPIALQG